MAHTECSSKYSRTRSGVGVTEVPHLRTDSSLAFYSVHWKLDTGSSQPGKGVFQRVRGHRDSFLKQFRSGVIVLSEGTYLVTIGI